MVEIKSTLEKIIQQAWSERDLVKSKKIVVDYLQNTKIKDEDKNKMLNEINKQENKYRFDYYSKLIT